MEEVMVAPPRAHEARIRIVCTSLCQSDINLWKRKDFPGITPRILGHEAIGYVIILYPAGDLRLFFRRRDFPCALTSFGASHYPSRFFVYSI
ncbi:unnamed protein product [Linum tenue]|uniref:Alcohol dehydrogenase-like N-terminal domain-containing protein n=1 Tax=Linum tenue TaxID=586396 RepID=A0AAV0HAC7_9ROSI|nr:unnamed protein product [Linum tenue]CAI0382342.1 unnamed protein product [Linum tenue]